MNKQPTQFKEFEPQQFQMGQGKHHLNVTDLQRGNFQTAPSDQFVDSQLDGDNNPLREYGQKELSRHLEGKGMPVSIYEFWAVKKNDASGAEIFPPKVLIGTYSENLLYGIAGSPLLRFRSALQLLMLRVEKAAELNPDDVEYSHQTSLIWAEVGRLKDFIGTSNEITEIVAELRTARFQFLQKDTPSSAIKSLGAALTILIEAKRIDSALVDNISDILEDGGIDSLALDELRHVDG